MLLHGSKTSCSRFAVMPGTSSACPVSVFTWAFAGQAGVWPQPDAPPQPGRPYLLHGLRLAVHFRRGDIAENKRWADRMLSPYYFVNVVRQIMQVGYVLQLARCVQLDPAVK